MQIQITNTAFFFANLRIYDLRTGISRKFADLRFVDCLLQICGFAICELAHLRNLLIYNCGMSPRICDLQTNKKNLRDHLPERPSNSGRDTNKCRKPATVGTTAIAPATAVTPTTGGRNASSSKYTSTFRTPETIGKPQHQQGQHQQQGNNQQQGNQAIAEHLGDVNNSDRVLCL